MGFKINETLSHLPWSHDLLINKHLLFSETTKTKPQELYRGCLKKKICSLSAIGKVLNEAV